jgi:hypothetical protein
MYGADLEAKRLKEAIQEAKRFIAIASDALPQCNEHYSKTRAAYRRASLDLTNALVEVRKSRY